MIEAADWRNRQAALDAADDVEAAMAAAAERKWCRQLVTHASACLYYAGNSKSHRVAREITSDAADALRIAGKIAPEPYSAPLFRLRLRLDAALDAAIGHPAGGELEAVDAELAAISAALTDNPPPVRIAVGSLAVSAFGWLVIAAATYAALVLT